MSDGIRPLFFLLIQTLFFSHGFDNSFWQWIFSHVSLFQFHTSDNSSHLGWFPESCSSSRLPFFSMYHCHGSHTKSEWCRFNFQPAVFLSSLLAPTVWAYLWSVRFAWQNLQTQHQENTVKYFLFQYFFVENYVWHAYNVDKGWKWKRRKEIVK